MDYFDIFLFTFILGLVHKVNDTVIVIESRAQNGGAQS